jgi:hypothetical protein
MNRAFQALVWEQIWKNRIVFPLLALLLILGAALTHFLAGAEPGAWWVRLAQRTLLTSFAASVLLSFAPFTLMESHHGWRMNSMVTRWFVLPVRTSLLVLIPFVAACLVVGLFLGTWMTLFQRLVPELDYGSLWLAFMLGVAVMQTLAWILPRKPGQFWPALMLGFPALLLLTLILLDGPRHGALPLLLRIAVPAAVLACGGLSYLAARLNRCGVWPGEIPLGSLARWLLRNQPALPAVRTPVAALCWSDIVPIVRTFLATWVGFLLLILGTQILMFSLTSRGAGKGFAMILQIAVVLTPPLAVFWLAVGGLLLGGEPGMGFRTRLSSFRAVRPVSAGTLAAQRVAASLAIWLLVWVPWLGLLAAHTHLHPHWASVDIPEVYAAAGRLMAISASVLIGALPLFLWGRLEGFPNMLLAAILAWAGTWGLAGMCAPPPAGELPWIVPGILLPIKGVAGACALGLAWQRGHITWRYAAALALGWVAVLSLLVWGLPVWRNQHAWGAATVALLLPFVRPALAPLALAANRHR